MLRKKAQVVASNHIKILCNWGSDQSSYGNLINTRLIGKASSALDKAKFLQLKGLSGSIRWILLMHTNIRMGIMHVDTHSHKVCIFRDLSIKRSRKLSIV